MEPQEIYSIPLKKHTEDYKKAKQTLKESFPTKELSPLWALTFLSKHPGVDFLTWYNENDQYIGVSYSIHQESKMLLLYLAIDKSARNKGYGTKIINQLQNKDKIIETVVDIESPLQPCENQKQRLKRLDFYKRLGFHSTNQEIQEPECNYLILGTNQDNTVTVETYKDLTKKLTGGIYKLNIKKVC